VNTLADIVRPHGRRAAVKLVFRRLIITLMVLIVVLGGVGALGVHTSSATAESNGYRLTLQYAKVARAGLDAPWRVYVSNPAGFTDDIELAIPAQYFEIFETQGFIPEASEETSDGTWRYMTFDRPPAKTFRLSYDAYIQPSAQHGSGGELRLLVNGKEQAHVRFHTYLLP
jgi:hypothetical protein